MNKNIDCSKVNICFATDSNYAPYLKVALYSLLQNRNTDYTYNILILHTELSHQCMEDIRSVALHEVLVNINFIDVSNVADKINGKTNSYISQATNYRLLLFSDMFSSYDRIIYLDCDIIVECDISALFFADMKDYPIAAVEETDFRQLSYCKKAVFLNKRQPYNIDNYRTEALKMQHPESYFNAGVMLLDLKKCRNDFTFYKIPDIFGKATYQYNDQDVLNILFDGQVMLMDYTWNYHNNVEYFSKLDPAVYGSLYTDVLRANPGIIHYVSSYKPWNTEVPLGEHYHKYAKNCNSTD